MLSWRDHVLKEFPPDGPRLTLAEDPDCLLTEEQIARTLEERGYDLLTYEDPVAFRLIYESQYRHPSAPAHPRLAVPETRPTPHVPRPVEAGPGRDGLVVRTEDEVRCLPYDLLRAGRRLVFGLAELFPNLSYRVIAGLETGDLDALFEAQRRHKPRPLGVNATRDFVLRHVFDLAPETIRGPAELLHVLLRRHYRGQRLPGELDEYLIRQLRQNAGLRDWPLERVVGDREAFFAFLQERWALYLEALAVGPEGTVRERAVAELSIPGPSLLPFEHHDVRVYIDNLFLEGELRPISLPEADRLLGHWVAVGLRTDPEGDRRRRLERLLDVLEQGVPGNGARHQEWLGFARNWAELLVLRYAGSGVAVELGERFRALREQVDGSFLEWTLSTYGSLYNHPPLPPVMVHHLPRLLSRGLGDGTHERVALLVLDGLALDQWVVLREVLRGQSEGLRFREQALFAWAPTLTSVSRQALFAGKPPLHFPASLHTSDREGTLWERFWVDEGLAAGEVGYRRAVGEGDLDDLGALLSHPRMRVVGLVVDVVDRIIHGMQLGTAGMHGQVRQWAEGGFPARLLGLLLEHGFAVYLTSDHGNVEAVGIGRPGEGVVAEVRGVRARVYGDALTCERVRSRFPGAVGWPGWGLPADYLPLLAPGRAAFAAAGEGVVGHGGISLEELIVPLVRVEGV